MRVKEILINLCHKYNLDAGDVCVCFGGFTSSHFMLSKKKKITIPLYGN